MSRVEVSRAFLRCLDKVDEYRDLMDTNKVSELLRELKDETLALMDDESTASAGISRVDALKIAREHVEAMSTTTRGYQDGVKMHDKVQATERFARFLMGESV